MSWTMVPFGKYAGKTLPEIIVLDLDWFFWMLPKLYGRLGTEAIDLARKARAIKIPRRLGKKLEVEYRYEFDDRQNPVEGFAGLRLSKVRLGRRDGRQDFHTWICRSLFARRSTTSERAGT